jgi:hypothetical protein
MLFKVVHRSIYGSYSSIRFRLKMARLTSTSKRIAAQTLTHESERARSLRQTESRFPF